MINLLLILSGTANSQVDPNRIAENFPGSRYYSDSKWIHTESSIDSVVLNLLHDYTIVDSTTNFIFSHGQKVNDTDMDVLYDLYYVLSDSNFDIDSLYINIIINEKLTIAKTTLPLNYTSRKKQFRSQREINIFFRRYVKYMFLNPLYFEAKGLEYSIDDDRLYWTYTFEKYKWKSTKFYVDCITGKLFKSIEIIHTRSH